MDHILSLKRSLEITNHLLVPFRTLFHYVPVHITSLIDYFNETERNSRIMVLIDADKKTKKVCKVPTDYENGLSIFYHLIYNNRTYEIFVCDSPRIHGYYSYYCDFEPETYLFCYVSELRNNWQVKEEIEFSINIEKGTFLELFGVTHQMPNKYYRNCQAKDIDTIESMFKDKVILDIPKIP